MSDVSIKDALQSNRSETQTYAERQQVGNHASEARASPRLVVRDDVLPGLRVSRGRVPPQFASRKFEVGPLLSVPSLIRGPQPHARRDA